MDWLAVLVGLGVCVLEGVCEVLGVRDWLGEFELDRLCDALDDIDGLSVVD